jgi:glycosyltransferase involved in cell wall biosynthesis
LRRNLPGARLLLVGSSGERFDLDRRLERLGLGDGVERMPYVPEERMWSLMAACDVLVNLRFPTMGETSGSVVRALSLGKPLVVSDVGWFSELPDGVVLKVPVDELEVSMLEAAIAFGAEHADELGAAAQSYVETEHSLDRAADAYAEAIEVAAGGDAVDEAVLLRIAEAAVEVGHDDPSSLARAAVDAGILG